MVCVPCIVIPIFLYIWHRFLQPLFLPILKFWNPWSSKEVQKLKNHDQAEKEKSCPFSMSETSQKLPKNSEEITKKTL